MMHPQTFEHIDQQIRTLDRTALAAQPAALLGPISHLLTIYQALRPLLLAMSTLPLFPANWRNALVLFLHSLDALDHNETFKAGKDV
jgi:hypothetical protein